MCSNVQSSPIHYAVPFLSFFRTPIPAGRVSRLPGCDEVADHLLSMGRWSLPSSALKGETPVPSLKPAAFFLSCPKMSVCLCCCSSAATAAGCTPSFLLPSLWHPTYRSTRMPPDYWRILQYLSSPERRRRFKVPEVSWLLRELFLWNGSRTTLALVFIARFRCI